jgi:hypothetical protein
MSNEQKSSLSLILAGTGAIIAIVTVIYNFGKNETKNELVYNNYKEMSIKLEAISQNGIWLKTTLINHMKEDDKREAYSEKKDMELKTTIIEQNKELIKALKN